MMSNEQMMILQIINKKQLIKRSELFRTSKEVINGPIEGHLNSLKDGGFIDILTPLGETSIAITQKGMRILSSKSTILSSES